MDDPLYFAENFVKIQVLDNGDGVPGLIKFEPYEFQKRIITEFFKNQFIIAKIGRQYGKTTVFSILVVYLALFNEDYGVLIAANKAASAVEIMRRVKTVYENLPKWMQLGVVKWNEKYVEFDNGSRILSVATTPDAARGFSFSTIILDEFAFVRQSIAEEFYTSIYPTISSGKNTHLAIISTPKMNHFYKFWTDAVKHRSLYFPIDVKWDDVPGRDQKFKEETIRNIGEDRWLTEFEANFLGSSLTLIPQSTLQQIDFEEPQQIVESVRIFEHPEKEHKYFISVDTSRGLGLDNHAFTVTDITDFPYKVVATFIHSTLDHVLFPQIIDRTGRYYNNAYILVETNDNGMMVADTLYNDLEYENMLSAFPKGRAGQVLGTFDPKRMGLKVSQQTKRIGCATLKTLMVNNKLKLKDFEIVQELANFTLQGETYKAEPGQHDDLTMCLVNQSWATTQKYFEYLTDSTLKYALEERVKKMEDDLMPFGFYDDGTDDLLDEKFWF